MQLRPITPENQVEIRQLAVRSNQSDFVASVEESLADAYVWPDALFRAAYVDDAPVGFVLVFPFTEDGRRIASIVRLMIDAGCQGRGLGRKLLKKTVKWIRSFEPAVDLIKISTVPGNEAALALYQSEGFREDGMEDGEIVLWREP